MLPWLMKLGPTAGRVGSSLGRPAWNLLRRQFSPGPWKKTVTTPYTKGFGKVPKYKYTPPGFTMAGGRTAGKFDPMTQRMQQGWAFRRPGLAAGAYGVPATVAGYGALRGDKEPVVSGVRQDTDPVTPWSAPEDMMSFAESEIARVEEGEQNFRKLMDYGMLIAATGGNADKFFERGKWVLEQSDQYAQDKQYAKAVRAVYKEGDMPKSARDAYERLTPLVGPEKAAVLSGHQLGMETGKTKEERAYNKIEEMAMQGDIEGAAAQLVMAWRSGLLKNPATHITNWEVQMERAREALRGIVGGGAGYPEGVQSIRPGVAASA